MDMRAFGLKNSIGKKITRFFFAAFIIILIMNVVNAGCETLSKTSKGYTSTYTYYQLTWGDFKEATLSYDPDFVKNVKDGAKFDPRGKSAFAPFDVSRIEIPLKHDWFGDEYYWCNVDGVNMSVPVEYFTPYGWGKDLTPEEVEKLWHISLGGVGKNTFIEGSVLSFGDLAGGGGGILLNIGLSSGYKNNPLSDVYGGINDMEKFIEAIGSGSNFIFTLTDGVGADRTLPLPLTNCVQLYGSGKKKVVTLRGASSGLDYMNIVNKSYVAMGGFGSIDPFSTYFNKFSFYADLKNHQNESNPTPSVGCEGVVKVLYKKGVYNKKGKEILAYGEAKNGYILYNTNPQVILRSGIGESSAIVHEVGHALANLKDETYANENSGILEWFLSGPNCQYNPKSYGTYGSQNEQHCQNGNKLFAPSSRSLMNEQNFVNKFNVVSCGYVLSVINGGSGPSNWPECMNLDTVKS